MMRRIRLGSTEEWRDSRSGEAREGTAFTLIPRFDFAELLIFASEIKAKVSGHSIGRRFTQCLRASGGVCWPAQLWPFARTPLPHGRGSVILPVGGPFRAATVREWVAG